MREHRAHYNGPAEIWLDGTKHSDVDVALVGYVNVMEVPTMGRQDGPTSWDGQVLEITPSVAVKLLGLPMELHLPNGRVGTGCIGDLEGNVTGTRETPFDPEIEVTWDVMIPANASTPDTRRLQRIWVSVEGEPVGGAFVSTTGYAEAILHLDDEKWRQAVVDAVRMTLRKQGDHLRFSTDPGSDDHFVLESDGLWAHRPLPKAR